MGRTERVGSWVFLVQDRAQRIGLASLTANHLCKQHNSDLSPLDQAGIEAFEAIRGAATLTTKRSKERPRKWKVRRFEADGPLLERWFLKTGINLSLVQQTKNTWQLTGENVRYVPEHLVQAAFGLDPLQKPMGLYAAGNIGEDLAFTNSVSFAPILDENGEVVGFTFTFQGLRFLMWVATRPIPNPLVLPNSVEPAWKTSSLYRSPGYLRSKINGHDSHYIDILWPGKKVPSWVFSPV